MTVDEIKNVIAIIGQLRHAHGSSELARKLEIEVCIAMCMMLPLKTNTPNDVLFPGIPKNVIQAMLVGILAGRHEDYATPFVLCNSNQFWRSYEQAPKVAE